jgi:hypothetical protein
MVKLPSTGVVTTGMTLHHPNLDRWDENTAPPTMVWVVQPRPWLHKTNQITGDLDLATLSQGPRHHDQKGRSTTQECPPAPSLSPQRHRKIEYNDEGHGKTTRVGQLVTNHHANRATTDGTAASHHVAPQCGEQDYDNHNDDHAGTYDDAKTRQDGLPAKFTRFSHPQALNHSGR